MTDGIARCSPVTLQRTDGLWITVCLTCPTRRGYNARGRTYVTVKEARMSGRDHARAKIRHRIKVREVREWYVALAVADSWEEWTTAAHIRHPDIYSGPDNGTWRDVQTHIRNDLGKRGIQWRS